MDVVSRKMDQNPNNTTLLKLNETEKDFFLQLFAQDFVKITETIKAKVRKQEETSLLDAMSPKSPVKVTKMIAHQIADISVMV